MIDYNSIVRLVLKLSGVGLVVYGGVSLSSYLPALIQTDSWSEWPALIIFANLAALAMPFLFGMFLWLFPAPVANTIVRGAAAGSESETFLSHELERIGVALLGLYLFYRAVSDLTYQLMIHRAKVAALGNVRAPDDFPALMTATVIELVLALIFLLRANGLVNLVRKVRGYPGSAL